MKMLKYITFVLIVFIISCKKDEIKNDNHFYFNPVDTVKVDTTDTINLYMNKLVGTWHCTETSNLYGISTFYVNIVRTDSTSNKFMIKNFYNYGNDSSINATLKFPSNSPIFQLPNNVNIPIQTYSGNTVKGDGVISISYEKINFTYYVNDCVIVDTCNTVLIKN